MTVAGGDDVPCLFISSSMPADLLPTDFILEPGHSSFSRTGLKYRSVFRTRKLALLDKSLVLRVLGELGRDRINEIEERLRIAFGTLSYQERANQEQFMETKTWGRYIIADPPICHGEPTFRARKHPGRGCMEPVKSGML